MANSKNKDIKDQEMNKDQSENTEVKEQEETVNQNTEEKNEAVKDQEQAEQSAQVEEKSEEDKLREELEESKDKYLRLYSEFENFRRRTAKERLDLVNTANKELFEDLLPVIDDFERADKAFDEKGDIKSFKEGYDHIYNKLKKITEQKGLKVMEVNQGDDFDPEFHEAVTQIPAPEEKLKGKIVDVIEKGYVLNDKVVRFAKVVTGS